MVSVRDVSPERLIEEAARKLRAMEELRPPEWAKFVKTGVSRERPPQQRDWWWTRAAAMLRKFYTGREMGVSRLRSAYSGRKGRGHKPEHRYRASGAVTRKILQQLEKAGLLKTVKGKGRRITQKGKVFLKEAAGVAGKG